MQTEKQVNWKTYAQTYDMLLNYNPFYQQLHEQVMEEVQKWQIEPGSFIADVGAGTGNYSLPIAKIFPLATVLHVDNDPGMNEVTADKRRNAIIKNHFILDKSIENIHMEAGSLQALISVHALYTFPNPKQTLRQMYHWLQPGGYAILVDVGRIVNVLRWQIAIGSHLIWKYGVRKTLEIMQAGQEINQQNNYIREMQTQGVFWTHSHQAFQDAVEEAGFHIVRSKVTFRGISDFVVARKG